MAVDIAHHAVNLLPFKIALIGTLGMASNHQYARVYAKCVRNVPLGPGQ